MGARERWKWGDLADSALVGAHQRWPALLQVLLQPQTRVAPQVSLKREISSMLWRGEVAPVELARKSHGWCAS